MTQSSGSTVTRAVALGIAALVLGGCANLRERPGFEGVQELVSPQGVRGLEWNSGTGQHGLPGAASHGPEMSADDAVAIALLRNPSLQVTYERLGFAEADLVEAGLLQNPIFAGAFMPGVGSLAGSRNVEVQVSQNVLQLLLMPSRKRIEAKRFEGVQLDVAARVLDVAAETRRAWVELVAQRNLIATLRVLEEAASATAEFAERLHEAGNLSNLELSRERGLAEDARVLRLGAEAELARPREALARLLAIRAGDPDWNVPERLPSIPEADPPFAPESPSALDGRLDIAAARATSDALEEAVELQRRWRFVPFVEVGLAGSAEPEEGWSVGPALALELPIFQQGQPALGRLEAALRQARNEIESIEIDARASARESLAALAANRALAQRYRDVTIPLRQQTTQEALRHYHYMLIGIFEVVSAKKDEIAAYAGYLESLRDWWIALADLERATGIRFVAKPSGVEPSVVGVAPQGDAHMGHSATGSPATSPAHPPPEAPPEPPVPDAAPAPADPASSDPHHHH